MNEYLDSVVEYFAEKADDYDLTDEQKYWVLSDQLLWHILETKVLSRLPTGARILDAGGGTGRWTDRLLRARPDASAVIFDLSKEMTNQARAKADARGYGDRVEIMIGDLGGVAAALGDASFDLVISFHNVLGFVDDPAEVTSQLVSLLNAGGTICLFVPNVFHTAYFNISVGRVSEAARAIATSRGRFTDTMPDMHLFSPQGLRDLAAANGLETELIAGTPILIYPGYAETQLVGETGALVDLLSDTANFDSIIEIEKTLLDREDLAERGNNLLYLGHRP